MPTCIKCSKALTNDEIALHKKLVNRGAEEFICIECLAKHFNVSIDLLYNKIKQFKEGGCTLFS